ncbi:MAG: adenylate/guanylate cyclase domain-containing protein [Candidatus Puniceispirillales bacterium]|jgi:adenylate cyclase|tara:strand:+ start:672 stop:2414 length:1743 start_codon:yes stop_codon:yes gene_type:complete
MSTVKRKLATILATDCVGFSMHMEEQEEKTLASLKACRDIIDPIIEQFSGRIFHTAGDSVIAEFQSPVECANAAIEFQNAILARNKKIEVDPKLLWRVGIHLDDIIIEGDNVYGNGVNIAARLEGQCPVSEILISDIVRQQINKKIDEKIYPLGKVELKNISEAFEVFSILGDGLNKFKEKSQKSINKKLKFAILPFTNTGNDEDSGFLVDGICEDLITEFSMMREFEILSRQTSINFKDEKKDIKEFSKEFNLDFIVNGSIRASGKRVRINIELSDARDDSIIWSNKYDRVLDDIFDLQDEIVRKISITLLGEIEISSLQRSKRKPTENISSYEYLLRGKEKHHQFTKEANGEALEYFDKAIQADPNNAQAYAWKVCTLGQAMFRGFSDKETEILFAEAKRNIDKSLECNENDFECHRMLSAVYLSNHDYILAEDHGKKSFNMVPNDPRVLSGYGEVLVRIGKVDEGLELLNKAFDLDPVPQGQSTSDNRIKDLILGHFFADNFNKVIELSFELRVMDSRSLALILYSRSMLDQDISKSDNYEILRREFKDINWDQTVDRFHIPNKDLNDKLISYMKSI